MSQQVIAGPIVRETSKNALWIWLATKEPLDNPRCLVYPHERAQRNSWRRLSTPLPLWSGYHHVQAGKNLHVYLITASASAVNAATSSPLPHTHSSSASLPVDKPLAYDIRWHGEGKGEEGLSQLGGYSDLLLPPFDMPTVMVGDDQAGRLRALYGSCRKAHGHGLDGMLAAEQVLRLQAGDVTKRPTAMLLGGDQIYADDVPDTMIRLIQQLGQQLVANNERLPEIRDPSSLSIGQRQSVTENVASLTSSHAANHLLTFGEFVATYVLAWNPNVWQGVTGPLSLPSVSAVYRDLHERPTAEQERTARREKIARERQRVQAFRQTARSARRALANIPTYMIFDDHEVTDDWNLNQTWETRLNRNSTGKRILSNGLAAFWLFQAWGNEPGRFSQRTMMDAIPQYLGGNGQALEQAYFNFHDWAFRTPGRPSVVFANLRTRRGQTRRDQRIARGDAGQVHWERRNVSDSPRLMDGAERSHFQSLLGQAQSNAEGMPIVVVVPTPAYGLGSLEWVQEIGAQSIADLRRWLEQQISQLQPLVSALDEMVLPLEVLRQWGQQLQQWVARLQAMVNALSGIASLLTQQLRDEARRLAVYQTISHYIEQLEEWNLRVTRQLDVLLDNAQTITTVLALISDDIAEQFQAAVDALQAWLGNGFAQVLRQIDELALIRAAAVDNESFHADPNSHLDLLQSLASTGANRAVLLAGDVHYGFSAASQVTVGNRQLRIAQFTSSASRNETVGPKAQALTLLQRKVSGLGGPHALRWWRSGNQASLATAGQSLPVNMGNPDIVERYRLVSRQGGASSVSELIANAIAPNLIEPKSNMGLLDVGQGHIENRLLAPMPQGGVRVSLATRWPGWPI